MAASSFYSIKDLELKLSESSPETVPPLERKRLKDLQQRYDQLLTELSVYSSGLNEKDRIIYRMARVFGETEVNLPEEFLEEVYRYIAKWQSNDRLNKVFLQASHQGIIPKIVDSLVAQDLPPQLLYLAVQESHLDPKAVGPKTRFGIAKGIWQLLPSMATEYGLRTGPLVDLEKYDPRDERSDVEKSSRAAAQFLRFLYLTEAQASGLLVMASYNWGPTRINNLIRKLTKNPQDRNFWKLLERFKIPQETRDYVFYIFSAAVIGENPRLFGFDFDNPLKIEG